MANHKSAEKRSRQTIIKTKFNNILLSQIKTNYNQFNSNIGKKKLDEARESLKLYNTFLSKGVKRGVIKKRNASRKLSSLSNQLKKSA